VTHDRDYTWVKGVAHLHSTLRTRWVCGECGSQLTTRWYDDDPNWRTVCMGDADHHPDGFVTSATYAYHEAQRQLDSHKALDVFENLPAELQAAIRANE